LRNSIAGDIKLESRLYVIEFVKDKHERRVSKMNLLKKIFMLVMIVAVISLGFTGCKHDGDHPSGDHPAGDHPAGEHPSKEAPSEEKPAGDHPAGEHPAGEHPK
jgi:hypothetical protein